VYGADGLNPTLNTIQGGNRQPFIAAERGRYNSEGKIEQKFEPRKDNISNTLTSVEKDNRVVLNDILEYPNTTQGHIDYDSGEMYWSDRVRRLTPLETERLQSFPDGWTNVEGTSDSQRYKMCGNAVTVNVIRDIIYKMIKNKNHEYLKTL